MSKKNVLRGAKGGDSQQNNQWSAFAKVYELHKAKGLSIELLNNAHDIKPRAH